MRKTKSLENCLTKPFSLLKLRKGYSGALLEVALFVFLRSLKIKLNKSLICLNVRVCFSAIIMKVRNKVLKVT